MRNGIERHADQARPAVGQRDIRQLRKDADHRPAQGIKRTLRILFAESTAAAENDAIVHFSEPAHHPLVFSVGPPRGHEAAGKVRRQLFGGNDGAAKRHQRPLHPRRRRRQVGIAVGGDDGLPRPHRAAGRPHDDAVVVMPEFDRGAFLIDRDAALGDTFGKAAQVIQRMDSAGTRIEHPADKAPRSRLFAHLMGIEDTNLGIAHLSLHPFGFVDRRVERRLIVRGLDLPAADQFVKGQPCFGPFAVAEPADPRREALESDSLLRHADPAGQVLIIGEQPQNLLVGAVDVLWITGQRNPAERPFALAE